MSTRSAGLGWWMSLRRKPTHRRALARCKVRMLPETTVKIASNAINKGDVLGAARIAGIQAAKRTPT